MELIYLLLVNDQKREDSIGVTLNNNYDIQHSWSDEKKLSIEIKHKDFKRYESKLRSITGIIGKNGSGKTRTIHSIIDSLKHKIAYSLDNIYILINNEGKVTHYIPENMQEDTIIKYQSKNVESLSAINNNLLKTKLFIYSNSLFDNIPKYLENENLKNHSTRSRLEKYITNNNPLNDAIDNYRFNEIKEALEGGFNQINFEEIGGGLYLYLNPKIFYLKNNPDKIPNNANILLNEIENRATKFLMFLDIIKTNNETQLLSSEYISSLKKRTEEAIKNLDIQQAFNSTNQQNLEIMLHSGIQIPVKNDTLEPINRLIKYIYDEYIDYLYAIDFGFTNISNGQNNLLDLNICLGKFKKEAEGAKKLIFIFDEADTGWHPEWQKQLIKIVNDIINEQFNCPYSLIFTSHSPFLISDLTSDQIIVLDPEHKNKPMKSFAGNIGDLYKNNLFMSSPLIGKFAEETIREIIKEIKKESNPPNNENTSKWTYYISQVADDFLRTQLEILLRSSNDSTNQK